MSVSGPHQGNLLLVHPSWVRDLGIMCLQGIVSVFGSQNMPVAAGEHMHEFEEFEANKFVSRLLGKGDWKSFIDKVQVLAGKLVHHNGQTTVE